MTATRKLPDAAYRLVALAVLIAAGVLATVAYCGGNTTAVAGDRDIAVTIANRKVSPSPGRVDVAKGSRIRLTVTSDIPDELHVHGYDRRATLSPGRPARLEFVADRTGLFEIETHSEHLLLFQLVVR